MCIRDRVKAISDVAQLDGIDNATVIIRSHGVSKNVYESIKTKNYEVVDATCPFVLKIHRIVEQESKAGKQIVDVYKRQMYYSFLKL